MNGNIKAHSRRTVRPCSWDQDKPGGRPICKAETPQDCLVISTREHINADDHPRDIYIAKTFKVKLPPPPPCPPEKFRASFHDLHIPPPPCAFQPPLIRSSSASSSRRPSGQRKNVNIDDDPFLSAYKECTKSSKDGIFKKNNWFAFSCKHSCSVIDDHSIIRKSTPQLPIPKSRRDHLGHDED